MRSRTFAKLTAIIAIAGLSGCGSIDDLNPFTEKRAEAPPPCPSVSILADAERLTVFRSGPGRDPTDVDTEVQIDDFVARCIYDVDEETGIGRIDIEFSLGIAAARGPANTSGVSDIPYFLAVTTLDKQLINKGVFSMLLSFEGNRYRLTAYDRPVILTIPIEPPNDGYDYRIYVGLQLTPDQLDYNRLLGSSFN